MADGDGAVADLPAALAAALGVAELPADDAFGQLTVDVPAERWVDAALAARARGFDFFDWLSAVDDTDRDGTFAVVLHVWSTVARRHLLLRTRVPGTDAAVPTLTGVYAGAGWHERETAEMFGIAFPGHPHLVPLLLPDGFVGHPLRKEFVLAARAAKAWPGAKEPGESAETAAPSRRRTAPPGVPDPATWGPRPPGAGAAT